MAGEHTTFLIIKPCAISDGHVGDIISVLETAGFSIVGMVSRRLTAREAAGLYDVHEGKEFFEPLMRFITSGPSIGVLMSGPDIRTLRELIGTTDPAAAAPGTIRALYGRTVRENAVHASDSPERARYESGFYFDDCPRALVARLDDAAGCEELEE